MFLNGIDVSHMQGAIDWQAVAQDPARIAFAYAKATEGVTYTDPAFAANYAAIKAAGLKRGAYHFFRPEDAVQPQVQNFLKALGTPQPDDLPPMLDVEVADGVSPQVLAAGVRQWLEQVSQALSCTPLIYTTAGFWNASVGDAALWNSYPLWIAEYTSSPQPILPAGATHYAFWQYSQSGKVAGIAVRP